VEAKLHIFRTCSTEIVVSIMLWLIGAKKIEKYLERNEIPDV
jgi:hypothetical protein